MGRSLSRKRQRRNEPVFHLRTVHGSGRDEVPNYRRRDTRMRALRFLLATFLLLLHTSTFLSQTNHMVVCDGVADDLDVEAKWGLAVDGDTITLPNTPTCVFTGDAAIGTSVATVKTVTVT